NQLISAVQRDKNGTVLQQVSYTYDILGNRIAQSLSTGGGAPVVTNYAYQPITEPSPSGYGAGWKLYADLDGSSAIQTWYVAGVGGPNAWAARVNASGSAAFLLTDHLGSVRVVQDMTGVVLD